jgi:uncharacterized protein YjbI with pentapeptide repeats
LLLAVVIAFVLVGLLAAAKVSMTAAFGNETARVEAAKVFFPVVLTLVGGPFLIWRVITAHLLAIAARNQAQIGRESHYTTLFTKAVEQLGATRDVTTQELVSKPDGSASEAVLRTEPNLEVRLGAIYALERIATDSERDHWPIMEVLSAYVRNAQNAGRLVPKPDGTKSLIAWFDEIRRSGPRVDIQAAFTVMCRRSETRIEREREENQFLDFSEANLQNIRAARGNLSEANFCGASLDFASFREIGLQNAQFDDSSFYGVRFDSSDLSRVGFEDCKIERSNFYDCTLTAGRFIQATLRNVTFSACDLSGLSFHLAQFSGVIFHNLDLGSVSFRQAILSAPFETPARFTNVNFSSSNLSFSRFDAAEVFGCDLSACPGLTASDFETAFGDGSTTLPSDIERPLSWPTGILSAPERYQWVHDRKSERAAGASS